MIKKQIGVDPGSPSGDRTAYMLCTGDEVSGLHEDLPEYTVWGERVIYVGTTLNQEGDPLFEFRVLVNLQTGVEADVEAKADDPIVVTHK